MFPCLLPDDIPEEYWYGLKVNCNSRRVMRILVWSASPNSQTGYGTAVRNLLPHLQKEHDVAVFAYAGLGDHNEEFNGAPVFFNPQMGVPGPEWLAYYDKKFKSDIILSWFDLWIISYVGNILPEKLASKLVGYGIVDSVPLSPFNKAILQVIYKVIPTCYWGKQVIETAGIKCEEPIYHGVDNSVFRPIDKTECRKKLGIPENAWIYLFCGTNYDLRKNIPNTLLAFKLFLDRCPEARKDAYLVLYTDPLGVDAGYDLLEMWTSTLGEQPATNIIFTKVEDYRTTTSNEQMATRFNAADIHILCSLAEGFGFTPLEAASCEVPSILTGWGPMKEIWQDKAFLVDPVDYFPTQKQLNWYCFPSTNGISEQIEYTYFHRKEVKKMGTKARKYALTLSWDRIGEQWLRLLDGIEQEKKGAIARIFTL